MFVLERVSTNAEIREQSEIDSIVKHLSGTTFKPILRTMFSAACAAATLAENSLGVDALPNRDPRYRALPGHQESPIGDLLFAQGERIAERCYIVQPIGSRLAVFEIRHHCVPTSLPDFCSSLERSVRARLDGRRVRGMSFDWHPVKGQVVRRVGPSSRFSGVELRTKKPEYSDEELRAARLLVGAESRGLLLQLAQLGKVRATDAKLPPKLVDELLAEQLLRKEYLVLCRKDSRTLCQVENLADLGTVSGGKLTCATCGRKFSEEIVLEIYAGTDAGKRLMTSSRWMTVWLTDLLIQAGVARETIEWSATAGEDEIDIMTDALGLRLFFELKDREFGLGDAYPFAYRVDRYGGSLGVVVSTDKIAEEAEKFFQEQRSKSSVSIDTLAGDNIQSGLRDLIDRYSRLGVLQLLSDLSGRFGINIVAPIVSKWMEMFAGAYRQGRYRPPVPQSEEQAAAKVAPPDGAGGD